MPYTPPTVGLKVYFYANDQQHEPHDATVIKVLAPEHQATPFTPVNLLVIDPDDGGGTFHSQVVHSPLPVPYPHYRWMPYQYEQAAKEGARRREREMVPKVNVIGGGGGVSAGCCGTAGGTGTLMDQQLYENAARRV